MAAQQPIAAAFNEGLVGRTLDVLIDAPGPGGSGVWLGRTYADAPDVDGVTLVHDPDLRPGDLIACEIVEARGYDLVARPIAAAPGRRRRRPRPGPRSKPSASLTILDGPS
jgi:ribosomal protein S12 methylthiotransferase